jgi:hypothetical protein
MDRYLDDNSYDNIDIINGKDYEDSNDEKILFSKRNIEIEPIINFDDYQIRPIKTNMRHHNIDDIIKLKHMDNIFCSDDSNSCYISLLILMVSIIMGILSCIPLASYQGDIELMTTFDLATCCIKAICGGLIFIGCWYDSINNIIVFIKNNRTKYDDF